MSGSDQLTELARAAARLDEIAVRLEQRLVTIGIAPIFCLKCKQRIFSNEVFVSLPPQINEVTRKETHLQCYLADHH